MYKKKGSSWLKHLDFAIFDLIVIAVVYLLVILVRFNFHPVSSEITLFTRLGILMLIFYFLSSIIGQNYKSILQRNKWKEAWKVLLQIAVTFLILVFYLFITQQGVLFSRIVFGCTALFGFVCIYLYRLAWKHFLRMRMHKREVLPWLLIVTDENNLELCKNAVSAKPYNPFGIKGFCIINQNKIGEKVKLRLDAEVEYPILCDQSNLKEYVISEVVDEVLIMITDKIEEQSLTSFLLEAGITVHIGALDKMGSFPNATLETIGDTAVITTSNNIVSTWQLICKRAFDIFVGIIGVVITGILFLILTPQIKAKDPGPVFFKQIRIGKNGRQFKFYKFRSMYLDAEERKKDLMDQNEMDGFMFKMENDPRILPGIGHKIRNWSLDEFPQFINVLKGDMSVIGTRPPTLEEFQQYEAHHKARLSFKPGITGLWQVNGRNQITDFEEIVKLDNTYIREWNLRLDLRIFFKTIKVVLQRKGAK